MFWPIPIRPPGTAVAMRSAAPKDAAANSMPDIAEKPVEKRRRRARKTGSRTVTVLMGLVVVLCVSLLAIHFYPTPCDKCGKRVVRNRGVRFVSEWRLFLPRSYLARERPFLCKACFDGILRASPAKDEASRQALATYLTDPAAASAVREAMQRPPRDASRAPFPADSEP